MTEISTLDKHKLLSYVLDTVAEGVILPDAEIGRSEAYNAKISANNNAIDLKNYRKKLTEDELEYISDLLTSSYELLNTLYDLYSEVLYGDEGQTEVDRQYKRLEVAEKDYVNTLNEYTSELGYE